VYGNSYFFKAFVNDTQYDDLKFALKAYTQAEKSQRKHKNPDLYYNRGVVHSYLENYTDAYEDFLASHDIDIILKADKNAEDILTFTAMTSKFIKNQCSFKPKKLARIISTIPINLKEDIAYTLGMIATLHLGENNSKIISAKIIQPVNKIFEVPL
jgi:tetratricopeptide (TPR) repeat protein